MGVSLNLSLPPHPPLNWRGQKSPKRLPFLYSTLDPSGLLEVSPAESMILSSPDDFAAQDSLSFCRVAALLAFLCSLEMFELACCAPGFQTRLWLQVCDAYRNQDAWRDFTSLLPYLSIFPNLGTVMHVKSSGSSFRLAFTSHIHQPCFHLSKAVSWIHFIFPLSMLLPRIRSSFSPA